MANIIGAWIILGNYGKNIKIKRRSYIQIAVFYGHPVANRSTIDLYRPHFGSVFLHLHCRWLHQHESPVVTCIRWIACKAHAKQALELK